MNSNHTFGWFMVLIAIAIVNPPSARAQGILRDLFRAANRGALPEPTTLNVPGKTVRIKVGQVETAAWAGTPQWLVQGEIKFGPLRLTKDGDANGEWNIPTAHCIEVDEVKKPLGDSFYNYDKTDNGLFDSVTSPVILEFVLPNDQRLYGQTLTADLTMHVDYVGLQKRPYQAPIPSTMSATMATPVLIKVASVEEAKQYSAIGESNTWHQIKFYGGLGLCLVFLLVVGRFLFGGRR
jgi:hypothetical protein